MSTAQRTLVFGLAGIVSGVCSSLVLTLATVGPWAGFFYYSPGAIFGLAVCVAAAATRVGPRPVALGLAVAVASFLGYFGAVWFTLWVPFGGFFSGAIGTTCVVGSLALVSPAIRGLPVSMSSVLVGGLLSYPTVLLLVGSVDWKTFVGFCLWQVSVAVALGATCDPEWVDSLHVLEIDDA